MTTGGPMALTDPSLLLVAALRVGDPSTATAPATGPDITFDGLLAAWDNTCALTGTEQAAAEERAGSMVDRADRWLAHRVPRHAA
jgi:hypothetical protein